MASHIEAIPCSPQTIDSLLPSIPGPPIVSKAITQLSGWSHPTHPESEVSISKTVSKPDDSSCLGVDTDSPLNPKCMTTLNWVEYQSKDKTIGKIM